MTDSEIHFRVYQSPRMSVAMIGDYMAAEDDERETIIHNARFQRKVPVAKYTLARNVLNKYITSDNRKDSDLHDAIESWNAELVNPHMTDHQRKERYGCIEVVENCLANQNQLGFSSLSTSPSHHLKSDYNFEEVRMSVTINALIHGKYGGKRRVGGLCLQLSKGKAEGKKQETIAKRQLAGEYCAVIVMDYLSKFNPSNDTPHHSLCLYANVRNGKIWRAPEHHKKMISRLHAAARVIKSRWNEVSPPSDFEKSKAKLVN